MGRRENAAVVGAGVFAGVQGILLVEVDAEDLFLAWVVAAILASTVVFDGPLLIIFVLLSVNTVQSATLDSHFGASGVIGRAEDELGGVVQDYEAVLEARRGVVEVEVVVEGVGVER